MRIEINASKLVHSDSYSETKYAVFDTVNKQYVMSTFNCNGGETLRYTNNLSGMSLLSNFDAIHAKLIRYQICTPNKLIIESFKIDYTKKTVPSIDGASNCGEFLYKKFPNIGKQFKIDTLLQNLINDSEITKQYMVICEVTNMHNRNFIYNTNEYFPKTKILKIYTNYIITMYVFLVNDLNSITLFKLFSDIKITIFDRKIGREIGETHEN